MAKMLERTPPPPPQRRTVGLGDVIEVIARPIARVLGLQHCEECDKRQRQLNDRVRIPIGRRSK